MKITIEPDLDGELDVDVVVIDRLLEFGLVGTRLMPAEAGVQDVSRRHTYGSRTSGTMSVEIPDTHGRVLYKGTHASISGLSDWDRDTDFDDKYLQGHATTAGTNGGNATHSHTQSHTHTGVQHSHSFSAASVTPTYVQARQFAGTQGSGKTHSHSSVNTNYTTITYQNDTTSTSSDAMHPPYLELILLKPAGGATDLRVPDDGVLFQDSPSVATGYSEYAAANGKFIKISAGSGDAGGTGGSSTHTHTVADHNHTADNHKHDYQQCGSSQPTGSFNTSGSLPIVQRYHHQVLTHTEASGAVNNHTGWTASAATSEPPYTALYPIANDSGSVKDVPLKAIIPFVGGTGDIPSGWILCDGSNGTIDLTSHQIKGTTTASAVGGGGGTLNHLHARPDHGHTEGTHTHTRDSPDIYPNGTIDLGLPGATSNNPSYSKSHLHTWTWSSVAGTINSKTGHSTDTADGRMPYRTVLWIQYRPDPTVTVRGGTIKGGKLAAA
jgi:hypothetical protein